LIWAPISSTMGTHMKTTLDIADPLLKQVKAVARQEGTTIRALVERGLQMVLSERRRPQAFKLRDGSVTGEGLHPDAARFDWSELLTRSYEGRGD
jgi:hypothetical protein